MGRNADVFSPDAGRLLQANSILDLTSAHLHANGRETRSHLEFAFKFFPKDYKPLYPQARFNLANTIDMDVKPNTANQELHAYQVLQENVKIITFEPHMHATGVRMCVEAIWGGSIQQLNCTSYDHNWVTVYTYSDGAEPLLTRVEKAGVQVLVLTVDVPMQARRDRDLRNALVYPPPRRTYASWTYLRHPGWTARALSSPPIGYPNMAGLPARSGLNPALQWDDVQWLARRWPGPLVVKGISHADDARRAIDCGAAGIIVSNHGGRQLDGAVSSLRVLPEIVAACPDIPIMMDGVLAKNMP